MLFLKLIYKEVYNKKKWTAFFVINLAFGFLSLIVTETFKGSIDSYFKSNSKSILGADLAVASRRTITQQEFEIIQKKLPKDKVESIVFDFYAMLTFGDQSRLVLVKAVDSEFPLYGKIEFNSGNSVQSKSVKNIIDKPNIWIQPELIYQMSLKIGDQVQLGKLKLNVADIVTRDSSQSFRFANIAPRVYIDRGWLESSGLIQFGSTYTQTYLFKLNSDVDADKIRSELLNDIKDPAIQIETPYSAGESSGQQLKYLGDYFGLVSLVSILISAFGLIYIFRMQISENLKNISIYNVFGITIKDIYKIILGQIALYSAVSFIFALGLIKFLLPKFFSLFSDVLPKDFVFQMQMPNLFIVYIIIYLGLILTLLPYLASLKEVKPVLLLKEGKESFMIKAQNYFLFIPAIILLWIVSVFQSHSIKIGSIFFFSLVTLVLLLLVFALAIFKLAKAKFNGSGIWYFKYSIQSLLRNPIPSVSLFITLALSVILINLIPQLEKSIKEDILFNPNEVTPDLFMFDIQNEQVDIFKELVDKNLGQILGLSPLVRGRILKVNGSDFERKIENSNFKTREEENETRFRNRGVNLSYRSQLSATEKIIEGRPFLGNYSSEKKDKPEISIEYKYAKRMGVSLGDTLTFDVQGINVEGQVVNLRKVKWSTFHPNFFIVFQPGVLDDAPKSYVGAVLSKNLDHTLKLQSDLSKALPNISIIDVKSALTEVVSLTEKMSLALEILAYLVLLSGFVILFIIIRQHFLSQEWNINLYKVLGATFKDLVFYSIIQISLIATLGLTVGLLLSQGINFFIIKYGFDVDYYFRLNWTLFVFAVIFWLSLIIGYLAVFKILHRKPIELLRS